MLKVKFYQIENLVAMKILEQGEEIKRGVGKLYYDPEENFTIHSGSSPAITLCYDDIGSKIFMLFIRGCYEKNDTMLTSKCFDTTEEASDYIHRAAKSIKNYNNSLKVKSEIDNSNAEIKITITE